MEDKHQNKKKEIIYRGSEDGPLSSEYVNVLKSFEKGALHVLSG